MWNQHNGKYAPCPNLDHPSPCQRMHQILFFCRLRLFLEDDKPTTQASVCTPHHISTLPRYGTDGSRQKFIDTLRCDGTRGVTSSLFCLSSIAVCPHPYLPILRDGACVAIIFSSGMFSRHRKPLTRSRQRTGISTRRIMKLQSQRSKMSVATSCTFLAMSVISTRPAAALRSVSVSESCFNDVLAHQHGLPCSECQLGLSQLATRLSVLQRNHDACDWSHDVCA